MMKVLKKRAMVRIVEKAGGGLMIKLRNGTGDNYMGMCIATISEVFKYAANSAKADGCTRKDADEGVDFVLAKVKQGLDKCVEELFEGEESSAEDG